jgi:SAM-dependent methyltransferase
MGATGVIPDPEKVRFWQARAQAYDRLCRRWEIFSLLSSRLIDLLPTGLQGPVLDIGAGSGLTSQLLLARRPHCQAILIEPSQAMLDIARVTLVGRPAQFFVMGLDEAPARGLHAVAALASASMQFLDLEPAFAVLARVIAPGGHVALNLWWHHWEDTADREGMSGWLPVAQAACREAQLPPPPVPPSPAKVKTRKEMMSACRQHGFQLLSEHRDEDLTPVGIGVDFQAMGTDWPVEGLGHVERLALLQRMHEIAQGQFETVASTQFLFQKNMEDR